MSLKKATAIGITFIFLFSFITHNLYDWFPTTLTSIFFPVNESIWEHQKMIFITVLIWGLIEHLLLKKFGIKHKNIISATFISAISNVIIFLTLYTPVHIILGHNFILTLFVYLITIIISQVIGYHILKTRHRLKTLNLFSIILTPIVFFIFGLFTYYPPNCEILFYDEYNDMHGIYSYHIDQ